MRQSTASDPKTGTLCRNGPDLWADAEVEPPSQVRDAADRDRSFHLRSLSLSARRQGTGPEDDQGEFSVNVNLPRGTTLRRTEEFLKDIPGS